MALYGASSFLADYDLLRTICLAGPKGSGKDMVAAEIAMYYLDRGYKYFSNQLCVWNDTPYNVLPMTDEEWGAVSAHYRDWVLRSK